MRLIDADDLKKTYYRELNIEPGETGACYIAFGMFPRIIDNARTINVEPKRGRWIYNGNFCKLNHHKCSVCGRDEFRMSRFCPNCGADMRGE